MIHIYSIVEKDEYTLMGQNDPEGRLFLHFDWKLPTFQAKEYKFLLKEWAEVLEALRNLGVTEVFSAIPKGEDKIRKWQTMFGLEPVAETDDVVYYRLEV